MIQTLLYTEKEAREYERGWDSGCSKWLQIFCVCVFPWGLSQKNTSRLWICTSTSHDAFPPPLHQRSAFIMQHPDIFLLLHSFFVQDFSGSLSPCTHLKVFHSCEIHNAPWVAHLFFLLFITGNDKSVYKHLVKGEFKWMNQRICRLLLELFSHRHRLYHRDKFLREEEHILLIRKWLSLTETLFLSLSALITKCKLWPRCIVTQWKAENPPNSFGFLLVFRILQEAHVSSSI